MTHPLARLMVKSLRNTTTQETDVATEYVSSLLSSSPQYLVIGKSTCPRCVQAVDMLSKLSTSSTVTSIMLDVIMQTSTAPPTTIIAVQDYLGELTGCQTVPRIFFNGKSLGGYDDILEQHENGTLPGIGNTPEHDKENSEEHSEEKHSEEEHSVEEHSGANAPPMGPGGRRACEDLAIVILLKRMYVRYTAVHATTTHPAFEQWIKLFETSATSPVSPTLQEINTEGVMPQKVLKRWMSAIAQHNIFQQFSNFE